VDKDTIEKIKANPSYQKLVTTRSTFAWTMTIIMFVVYYSFILFIAFSPETLGTSIGGSITTWGIPVGVGIILFAFVMTGIYVKRANNEFDSLLDDVKKDLGEMK
jgi:uncharacterized membrane protein (DUF485 family)